MVKNVNCQFSKINIALLFIAVHCTVFMKVTQVNKYRTDEGGGRMGDGGRMGTRGKIR